MDNKIFNSVYDETETNQDVIFYDNVKSLIAELKKIIGEDCKDWSIKSLQGGMSQLPAPKGAGL